VCFSAKEKGTWRGASLFVRRHPPHSLPGVYRFLPPAYNRAPPLHIATAHTPFLLVLSQRCGGVLVTMCSAQVDSAPLCGVSPSERAQRAQRCVRGLGAPLRGRRRQKPPSVAYSPRDALSGALGRSWWAGGAMRAHIGLQAASGSRWGARERPGGGQGERRRRRAVRAGGQRVGARGGSGSGAAMRCCCGHPNNGGRARASPRPGRGSGDRSPE